MPERTNAVNALDVSLSAELVAGAISMDVVGATDIPDAPFYLVVDPFSPTLREYMLCTAVSGSGDARTLTVTRNEDGSVGDVDHAAGNLVRFATVAQHISDLWDQVELVQSERVRWVEPYLIEVEYKKNDMVLDEDWTMIANKDTDERAAPQPIEPTFQVYTGPVATDNPVVSQIISGQKYVFGRDGYLVGYRVYQVTGNNYSVVYQRDGGGFITLTEFIAQATGWLSLPLSPRIVAVGTEINLFSIVNEPDPTPTTFVGDWNYQAPNNETIPAPGQITQANRLIGEMRVSYLDNDSVDREAELLALVPGDIIEGAGLRWSITTVTDEGIYVAYSVAPALQGSPLGLQEFKFETVAPTPITHQANLDWFALNPPTQGAVTGLFSSTGFDNIVENDTAYGVDIEVQDASISQDWDAVSYSG